MTANPDNSDSRAESSAASGGQKSENGMEMRLRRIGLPPGASRQAALIESESLMIATDGGTHAETALQNFEPWRAMIKGRVGMRSGENVPFGTHLLKRKNLQLRLAR